MSVNKESPLENNCMALFNHSDEWYRHKHNTKLNKKIPHTGDTESLDQCGS